MGVVGGSGWPNVREVFGDHSVSLDEFESNNSFAVGLVEFLAHWQVMMLMQWSIGKCFNVFFASGPVRQPLLSSRSIPSLALAKY